MKIKEIKNILIFTLGIFFIMSCSSIRNLEEEKYTYKSKNRELVITFNKNGTCLIKNIFYCGDIDDDFKEIVINASYKRYEDMIVLKNLNCKEEDCSYPPYIDIPIQNSSKCLFLNRDKRNNIRIFDGRTFQNNYYKYGLVPNIDIDTLHIMKNKIILVKKTESGSLGFIFSK